jgi:hypothetical protein
MISKGNARSGANLNDPCTSYEIAFPDSAKKYALMLIFRKYPVQSKFNYPTKYRRRQ